MALFFTFVVRNQGHQICLVFIMPKGEMVSVGYSELVRTQVSDSFIWLILIEVFHFLMPVFQTLPHDSQISDLFHYDFFFRFKEFFKL